MYQTEPHHRTSRKEETVWKHPESVRPKYRVPPAYCRSAICASPPAFPALRGRKNCKSTASRRLPRLAVRRSARQPHRRAAIHPGRTPGWCGCRAVPDRGESTGGGYPPGGDCRRHSPAARCARPRGLCPIGQRVVRGSRQAPASGRRDRHQRQNHRDRHAVPHPAHGGHPMRLYRHAGIPTSCGGGLDGFQPHRTVPPGGRTRRHDHPRAGRAVRCSRPDGRLRPGRGLPHRGDGSLLPCAGAGTGGAAGI